ncbi:MAG: DUF3841 domain-containing protein [Anaerolineae bacterium]
MKIWSIQSEAAFRQLAEHGVLYARPYDEDEAFKRAYGWMKEQMIRRIGEPPLPGVNPVWGWYQYQSARKRRPDLRQAAHVKSGEKAVRLALELPDAGVLLSDFDLWHYVLNDWHLPLHEQDQSADNQWEKIFDLDWYAEGIADPREQKSIQATFWSIEYAAIREMTWFIGR